MLPVFFIHNYSNVSSRGVRSFRVWAVFSFWGSLDVLIIRNAQHLAAVSMFAWGSISVLHRLLHVVRFPLHTDIWWCVWKNKLRLRSGRKRDAKLTSGASVCTLHAADIDETVFTKHGGIVDTKRARHGVTSAYVRAKPNDARRRFRDSHYQIRRVRLTEWLGRGSGPRGAVLSSGSRWGNL